MQAIKNGLKTTLRTPGKTALFLLIMTVLSALLSVSFCVFSAVRGYIGDADGYFHTIANLEFVGRDYPDQTVFDPAVEEAVQANMDELLRLKGSPAVLDYESASPALGIVDGLHRLDPNVYDPTAAVLLVSAYAYDPQLDQYSAFVVKSLYSQRDYTGKMIYITLKDTPLAGMELEKGTLNGNRYLLSGNYIRGFTAAPVLKPCSLTFTENGETASTPDYELIHGDEVPEESVFYRCARMLNIQNNACRVSYTANLEDSYPFHQQILRLKAGRFFTEEEQKGGARVCLIVNSIASLIKVTVGDTVSLSVLASETSLFDTDTLYEKDGGEFEVVGILHDDKDYPYWIFLPGEPDRDFRASTGYTVGQFRLKNSMADEFMNKTAALSEKGFRVTLYDQGYAAATEPMRELEFISIIFLAVCVLLAIAALILQSHVFVSRQRESAQTMYSLGSGRAHIILYFLSSALLLTLFGSLIGVFAARALEGRVFEIMQRFAIQFAEQDARFSSTRLAQVRTLDFAPEAEIKTYIIAAAALIAGAAAATLCFCVGALSEKRRAERKRVKKSEEPKPILNEKRFRGKTSRLSGRLKYALLSIGRSPVRTVSMLLFAAVAAGFFAHLTGSLRGYEEQLESYKRSAVINGCATDMRGKWMDGLLVKDSAANALVNTDCFKDFSVTKRLGACDVLGVRVKADGTEQEVFYSYPSNPFQYETRIYHINKALKMVAASEIETSPMFKYAKAKSITWLEGFDKADFWFPNPVCALPKSVMEQKGIELGDIVRLECAYDIYNNTELGTVMLRVVASYASTVLSNTAFVPLAKYPVMDDSDTTESLKLLSELYEDKYKPTLAASMDERIREALAPEQAIFDDPMGELPSVSYSSLLFTLKSAEELDEARQALYDSGFTYVGSYDRARNYAIIEDEIYLSTLRSMQRQIQYVSVLYYALYVIAGIIGFALAWLLTASRRKEIALMRALGTPYSRVILNFLFEHALLCLLGLCLGLGAAHLIFGMPQSFSLILCAAFFALWCIATFLCLVLRPTEREEMDE